MKPLTIDQIRTVLKAKGYKFFDDGEPYNLNIIGVRSLSSESNKFDDAICVIYRDENKLLKMHQWPFTTDPGKPWLLKPITSDGTLIMKPGQYVGAYKLGIHGRSRPSGGYKALEQIADIEYVRDNNRDAVVDNSLFDDPKNIITGNFKTNIHRASKWGVTKLVETYSAGCQVFASADDFNVFIDICEQQLKARGQFRYTYTLLLEQYFQTLQSVS